MVWALAAWRNEQAAARGEVPPIPENSITKPPSAELAPGQLDSDSLPDYAVLDRLLDDYVERDMGSAELIAAGHDPELVERIIRLVDRAEYKRRRSRPARRSASRTSAATGGCPSPTAGASRCPARSRRDRFRGAAHGEPESAALRAGAELISSPPGPDSESLSRC